MRKSRSYKRRCRDCIHAKVVRTFDVMVECVKGMWKDEAGRDFLVSWQHMDRWKSVPYRPETVREPMAHACIFFEDGDDRAVGSTDRPAEI